MENIIILPNHLEFNWPEKIILSKNLFSIHFLPKTFRKQFKNLVKLIHGLKKHKK